MDEATFRARLAALSTAEPCTVDWAPGHASPEHTHEFRAFGLVLAGAFTLELPDGPRFVPAGQTFELAAGVPHREVVGSEGARVLAGRIYAQ
ncbi:MAG: cupin domain-containing protein [Gammaproteobacteria bacterium]